MQRFQIVTRDDTTGGVVPSPNVQVNLAGTSTAASLFSDKNGSTPMANPFVGTSQGLVAFYAAGGRYDVIITSVAGPVLTLSDVILFDPATDSVMPVASVAALRLTTGTVDGQRADTRGYLASGDGGSNTFYWSATSALAENGGTIIKPTAVTGNGRWLAVNPKTTNLKQFGAGLGNPSDTLAIQAAINSAGIGGAIYAPAAQYNINGTVQLLAGQSLYGDGWSTVTNSFAIAGGTQFVQYSTADIPVFSIPGTSNSDQRERVGIRDIAISNNNRTHPSYGQGIKAAWARMLRLENVHIDGFNFGVYMLAECWNSLLSHLHIYDCDVGIYAGSGSEDGVALACDISLFRAVDAHGAATHCVYLANQCQNFTFIGCGLHFAAYAVRMDQGDTSRNGTGIPYPMHATFIGCYLEDLVKGGFWLTSSNPNYSATKHAGLTIKHIRAFNGGAWTAATPNAGQPLVIAQHCSQIGIDAINSDGFSYGASIGEDFAGIAFAGSVPGPIDWGLDNSAAWGTSRLTPGSKTGVWVTPPRGVHQG